VKNYFANFSTPMLNFQGIQISKKFTLLEDFFSFLFLFTKPLEEFKDMSKGCVTKTKCCILTNGVFSSSKEVMTG